MRNLIAIFMTTALLLFSGPKNGWAESAPGKSDLCATVAKVRADVAAFPFATTVTQLTPDQSMSFLTAFNALPPRSELTADFIMVVMAQDKPTVILALFKNGCVSKTVYMPRSVFLKAMGVEA